MEKYWSTITKEYFHAYENKKLDVNNKEHRAIVELAAECNSGPPKENTTLNQVTNRTKVLLRWIKKKKFRPTKEERKKNKAMNEKKKKNWRKKETEQVEKLRIKYPEWHPWLGHVPPLKPPPKPFLEKTPRNSPNSSFQCMAQSPKK